MLLRRIRRVTVVLFVGLTAVACGADADAIPDSAATTLVSSPESIAVGEQRLIFQLRDGVTRFGGPDLAATVELDTLGVEPVAVPATWVWADEENATGAYVVAASFDGAGTWLATLKIGEAAGQPVTFTVFDNAPMPQRGEAAPATATDTLTDLPLAQLTTDPNPDRRLYETSIAEGLAQGAPMTVVFSTPKYCTTSVCGPMLDLIKSRIDEHDTVTFVHVEVYEDFGPEDTELQPRPAILDWGIPTEPWVFTIDSAGTVDEVFEGVLASDELDAALAKLR